MPIRCIPAVIALLLAFSACVSVTAEEVEKLGPQLIAEGAFLSGDGDEPQKPAGWLITTDEDGTALWLEEGHRDRGSAKLEGPRIESTVSLSQQRWLGTASQCYLLSFYYRGNNVTVEARLTVKGDGGRSLASVTRSRPVQSGWNEFRMFFEPWPLGLNGELETVLAMHGRGHVQLDGVSLTAYEGPYTRRDRSFGSDMPVSPPTSGKAESPVLFTWPAFAGREIYTLEVEFPDGMIYIADVHNNCSLVELPVGEYSWTVNAVLGDDEFIEIVPFTPLTVTAVRGKLPQKPVRPATPLPGDDSDYARWRKLGGISRIDDSFLPLAGREWIPGMPIPGQASPGRELDINTIALNWDAASDTLANASAVKRLGGKNCDPVAREITQNMQEEAQNTGLYLPVGARSRAILALCAWATASGGKTKDTIELLMRARDDVAAVACANPADYDALRLFLAAYIASVCEQFHGFPQHDAALALLELWFPASGCELTGSVLARDLPLFVAAANVLAGVVPVPKTQELRQRVLDSVSRIATDFPMTGLSSFGAGDSTPADAALLLAWAGASSAVAPVGSLGSRAGNMGLLGLREPDLKDAFEPCHADGSFALGGLPGVRGAVSWGLRASPFGTDWPFGATLGHFGLTVDGHPVVGFGSSTPDVLRRELPTLFRSDYQNSLHAGWSPVDSGNADTSARILKVRSAGLSGVVEADITGSSVDFLRTATRRVAFVVPPGARPFAMCLDAFSTWYGTPGRLTFRLPGSAKTDQAASSFSSDSDGGKVVGLVAFPDGATIRSYPQGDPWAKLGDRQPWSTVEVLLPKEAKECLTAFVSAGESPVAVERLNGDGFCGIRMGDTVAAFRTGQGGAWLAGRALTDASFFAVVPLSEGRFWLFAADATTFDWDGAEVFASSAPATVEVIFDRAPDHKTVQFRATGQKGEAKTPDGEKVTLNSLLPSIPAKSVGLRPKLSLFSDDSAGDAVSSVLAPSLELVRLPLLLRGAYRIEVEVGGPAGSHASVMLGTNGAELDPAKKATSTRAFSGVASGLVTLTALLHGGCKLKAVTVEKVLLPNGGLESWSGNLPEGFRSEGEVGSFWREKTETAEGECSLGLKLAAGKKGGVLCRLPAQGRSISVSARVLMQGTTKTDMRTWLTLRFYDEQGKQVGKEVVGRDSRAGNEWTEINLNATVPPKAREAALAVSFETNIGEGKAFVDDLRAGE